MATTTTKAPDLPAASGLTGQTTDLPTPGEFPSLDVETQVPIIIGVASAFLALSTIMVLARLYTRYGLIKVAGDDDITIAVAQVGLKLSYENIGYMLNSLIDREHWSCHYHNSAYVCSCDK